ncbi:hypothetical protein INT47_013097, partial [Mucor saturninus]
MLPTSHDVKKEKLKDTLLGLHWAAITGNVGLVKFALDHGVPIDSTVNGFVPLQLACISDNNIAVVQYLIDRGADVNMQKWSKKHCVDKSQAVPGATGSTALHVACANGCIKIVDLLLRNYATVDLKDKYGSTPLDVAQAKHETEIVHLLKAAKVKPQKDGLYKRTDKQKRRPSMPSIFEGRQQQPLPPTPPPPPLLTMTPYEFTQKRSLPHRPSVDENSVTLSYVSIPSSHSSSDECPRIIPSSPATSLSTTTDGSEGQDYYGYGVVNTYDEDNYLLSLEKRAYNLGTNKNGELERHSQDISSTSSSFNESDHEEEEDHTFDDYPMRYSMDQPETKRGWFSGFGKEVGRHSLDSIHRKEHHDLRPDIFIGKKTDDHKTGFFS